MTGPSDPETAPSKQDQSGSAKRDGTVAEAGVKDRRYVLSLLRKAAIASPVLMTLKSAPARAVVISADMSANSHVTN